MQARVDGVIEKVRAIHRAAEDRGAEAAKLGECTEKDRRKAAEDADVVIVSHGHFSRVLIACVQIFDARPSVDRLNETGS
jgi:broad specificity phosphatase PhoE